MCVVPAAHCRRRPMCGHSSVGRTAPSHGAGRVRGRLSAHTVSKRTALGAMRAGGLPPIQGPTILKRKTVGLRGCHCHFKATRRVRVPYGLPATRDWYRGCAAAFQADQVGSRPTSRSRTRALIDAKVSVEGPEEPAAVWKTGRAVRYAKTLEIPESSRGDRTQAVNSIDILPA